GDGRAGGRTAVLESDGLVVGDRGVAGRAAVKEIGEAGIDVERAGAARVPEVQGPGAGDAGAVGIQVAVEGGDAGIRDAGDGAEVGVDEIECAGGTDVDRADNGADAARGA